ncbi:hypothetical protein D9M73_148730 [compost metagenome]
MFGFLDVRTPVQHVGRQARRYFGQQVAVEVLGRWQVVRHTGAEQYRQAVLVLGNQALVLGQLDPGAFYRGPCLAQVQGRSHTHFVAAQGQRVALLVGLEGVFGQLEQGLVGLPSEVGVGHAGHQADLGRAPGLFAGQVDFQLLLGKAAYPAEQVQLVGAHPEGGRVLAGDLGITGLRQVGRHPLAAATAVGADCRKQVGPLDAVLRPVGIDVQCRDPKVAVVDQRGLDQLLQRRVIEELTPALLGGSHIRRLGRRIGRALRPLRGHRRFRGLVVRDQRAAAKNESGYCQGQQGLTHCPAS